MFLKMGHRMKPSNLLQQATENEWLAVARRASGESALKHIQFFAEELHTHAVNQTTGGIFRIHGTGMGPHARVRWTVILKVLQRPSAFPQWWRRDSWNFWKGEAQAYQAFSKASVPLALEVPRCYLTKELDEAMVMLFIEDVGVWKMGTPAQWRHTFSNLAKFNLQKQLEGMPSRNWLKSITGLRRLVQPGIRQEALWKNRWVRVAFPNSPVKEIEDIFRHASKWLERIEKLPKGLAHLDAQPSNFFWRSKGSKLSTLAIDWSNFSWAPLGTDLGQLFQAMAIWLEVRSEFLADFLSHAEYHYVKTLKSHRSDLDVDTLRFAIRATAAMRVAYFAPYFVSILPHVNGRKLLQSRLGSSLQEVLPIWGRNIEYVLRLPFVPLKPLTKPKGELPVFRRS